MTKLNVTRGSGFLEGFLAEQRARIANKLIPDDKRKGRILDIGCGVYPYFLLNTRFNEKYGLDKVSEPDNFCRHYTDVDIRDCDVEERQTIPFPENYFDIVTMLAVLEHIDPPSLTVVLKEIKRILKTDGIYILTTPAPWADKLLRMMARLNLVSPDEINEHKDTYSYRKIIKILETAGFEQENVTCGYFECYLNIWTSVKKSKRRDQHVT